MIFKKNESEIFNRAKWDSFVVLIPIGLVEIVSPSFTAYRKVIISTAEAVTKKIYAKDSLGNIIQKDDDKFEDSYFEVENEEKGTKIKYKKLKRMHNGFNVDYMQIMLTAKLLHENYFEGINQSNITSIYNQIIDQRIIYVSYDDFMNSSLVVDCDLCKDFQLNEEDFFKTKSILIKNVLENKSDVLKYSNSTKNGFTSIQYNERSKATPSKPFVKFYNKTSELTSGNTNAFTSKNLTQYLPLINKGIARIEGTIKNSKHKQRLEIKDVKTLSDLMLLSQEELDVLHTKIFNEYYSVIRKDELEMEEKLDLSPTDLVMQMFLNRVLKNEKDLIIEELLNDVARMTDDVKKRCKAKQIIKDVVGKSGKKKLLDENELKYKNVINVLKNVGLFEE